MRWMKWIGLAAGILLIISCFSTWVFIESKSLTITGIDATGTSFGKPGYLHLIFATCFLVLNFIPRLWAKRTNLPVTAFNLAWAARNYFIITACHGGECPEKHNGIYLLLLASALLLVSALFPDIKLPANVDKR
jgi:hypothetical protein